MALLLAALLLLLAVWLGVLLDDVAARAAPGQMSQFRGFVHNRVIASK